jgi:hypothetical protein
MYRAGKGRRTGGHSGRADGRSIGQSYGGTAIVTPSRCSGQALSAAKGPKHLWLRSFASLRACPEERRRRRDDSATRFRWRTLNARPLSAPGYDRPTLLTASWQSDVSSAAVRLRDREAPSVWTSLSIDPLAAERSSFPSAAHARV